jgi:hypothetical protein
MPPAPGPVVLVLTPYGATGTTATAGSSPRVASTSRGRGGSDGVFRPFHDDGRDLRATASVASVYPGIDFPMVGNVPTAYAVQWLAFNHGRRMNSGPWSDNRFWQDAHRDVGDRPYRDLDLVS